MQIAGIVRNESGVPVAGRTVRAYRRDTGALLGSAVTTVYSSTTDPDFANVKLLLRGDGTHGSTTIPDISSTPKTVTVSNGAIISTTQAKFGPSSIEFPSGSGGRVSADSAAFNPGAGSFTFEAWVYHTAAQTNYEMYCDFLGLQFMRQATAGVYSYYGSPLGSGGTTPSNQWVHVVACRQVDTLRLFTDGALALEVYLPATFSGSLLRLGFHSDGSSYPFKGFMDEVRLTIGVARYTAAFTGSVPTARFPTDVPTITELGAYTIDTTYTGEVNVVALDDAGGTVLNDLILRTTPV
jgi:hypothetical protein